MDNPGKAPTFRILHLLICCAIQGSDHRFQGADVDLGDQFWLPTTPLVVQFCGSSHEEVTPFTLPTKSGMILGLALAKGMQET